MCAYTLNVIVTSSIFMITILKKWRALDWGITWRYNTAIIINAIQVYILQMDFFYGSRYCDVACNQMIMTFWHVNWEMCIIPMPKTVYVYLKPFLYSVPIKITKHGSYICIQELVLTFSIQQKKIFDRWSCVTYQTNCPTPGYTLQCKKTIDNVIKIAPTGGISNRSMVQKHPVPENTTW